MVIGLSLLLVIRLVLFVLAGLAWQGLINEHLLIPPLDRAATLFGLILILWMWGFPEPLRWGDAATWLLALLAATGLTLNLVWWTGQGNAQNYNGSWPDFVGEIACIVVILAGGLVLAVRKPNGWGFGLGLFGLALVAHVVYLALPVTDGDYSGLVRLSEMAYYPLLLFLPQRFPVQTQQVSGPVAPPERRRTAIEPRALDAIFSLINNDNPGKVCQSLTQVISTSILADICLLLSPPNESGEIIVLCGYDLIREDFLSGVSLPTRAVPLITAAANRGLPLRLPASSTSEDLRTLGQALHLERPGHLLAAPIGNADGKTIAIIALLSPYSSRAWTGEDQLLIASLSSPMARLLQQNHSLATLQNALGESQQALAEARKESETLQAEMVELQSRLQTLQEEGEINRAKAESLAALVATQSEAGRSSPLAGAGAIPVGTPLVESKPLRKIPQEQAEPSPEPEFMEGELRLALQEVAQLKSALSEADQRTLALKNQLAGEMPSDEHYEEIATIVQEMRQPMSSILGYTDFLLGESIGILGALQRKFLERIKMLTDRMNRLVTELTRLTSAQMNGEKPITEGGVDLYSAVEGAISESMEALRDKDIKLRVDCPENLPLVNAAEDAIRQVLVNLIDNAKEVTPESGEVALRASLQGNDYQRPYILIQVVDQGGGIPADYIPRVFSRFGYANGKPIPGTGGKSSHLSVVKMLVENSGGRIWVDSQADVGATFSILLPVSDEAFMHDEPGSLPA
jgi:signal transduction histidine kinase